MIDHPLHLVTFTSGHYPEDNRVIGIYTSTELAKLSIKSCIEVDMSMHPNHPLRYQQHDNYYDITEMNVNE